MNIKSKHIRAIDKCAAVSVLTSVLHFQRLVHRKCQIYVIYSVWNKFRLTLLRPKMSAILSGFFIKPGIDHAPSTVYALWTKQIVVEIHV